jgi:two-component system, NarL family, sensor histidine kinase UhpB
LALGFPKVAVDAPEVETRAAVVTAVEALPGHLARELHDQVAQPLVTLVLQLDELASRARGSEDVAAELAKVEDSARAVLRNTRELLVDLRGQGEIRLNFRQVLKNELIRSSATSSRIMPALQVSSTWPQRINGWAAFNLLRIVQESIANALRHGRATRVEIILSTSGEEEGVIVVLDDGAGLGDAPAGIGMIGMQERAVILGGTFSAVPRPGGGTRVEVRVPLSRLR